MNTANATTQTTSIPDLDKLTGQPVDIAPSAYQWRADRKPEDNPLVAAMKVAGDEKLPDSAEGVFYLVTPATACGVPDDIYAHPVAHGSRLYLRSLNALRCFEEKP